MFANVGWGEMLVLVVIGLVVLGPERLPGAIRWTSSTLRQARDYISGATSQLREDLGPEFDDLRAPLSELNKLRGMSPRAANRVQPPMGNTADRASLGQRGGAFRPLSSPQRMPPRKPSITADQVIRTFRPWPEMLDGP